MQWLNLLIYFQMLNRRDLWQHKTLDISTFHLVFLVYFLVKLICLLSSIMFCNTFIFPDTDCFLVIYYILQQWIYCYTFYMTLNSDTNKLNMVNYI
jgi:hypothetical protein